MAGANLVNVRLARNRSQFDAGAFGLTVAMVRVNFGERGVCAAVNLLHDGEIETAKQMRPDGVRISRPAVTSDLNHAGNTLGQVSYKVVGVGVIALARQMRDNQLRAPVKGKIGVKIAALGVPFGCAALAHADTRPKLIKLDGLGFDVADGFIVKAFALLANDAQHVQYSVFVAAAQSSGCLDSAAFRQAADNLDDFGFVQTQADEPALLVEVFAARRIQTFEPLHGLILSAEKSRLFGLTATAYTFRHLRLSRRSLTVALCSFQDTTEGFGLWLRRASVSSIGTASFLSLTY